MANPWFRLYSEFMHDPKVQILSESDQRRLIMLLCMRCNSDVTLQDKYVTFTLRISDDEWTLTKSIFVDAGFIDSDNNVLNWDKRQFVSDSSAERVKRHREATKIKPVTSCNVTVTSPDTEQNRTDTEQNKKKPSAAFALPDWINADDWNLWIKTRKGKKMLPEQMQAQVEKLRKWKDAGLPYWEALRDSASNGWQGLFEPKVKFKTAQDSRLDFVNQVMGNKNGTDRQIRDITGECSAESDRARIPEIIDGLWESNVE